MALRVDRGPAEFAAAHARRHARLAVNGEIQLAIKGLELAVELRDLSYGGFSISATRPFWKGMTHWFTFSTKGRVAVTLVAKVVHSQAAAAGDGAFISGWEFMRGTADKTDGAIGQLLDSLS